MNLNILSPGKAVEAAFEKPNLAMALGLVLAASIVWLGYTFVIAGMVDLETMLFSIASSYLGFFVLVAVFSILCLLLNAGKALGKFSGALSALSLLQLIHIITYILSIIAFVTVIPAEVAAQIDYSEGGLYTAAMEVGTVVSENLESINIGLYMVFMAIEIAFSLLGVYILYLAARRFANTGALGGLLISIVSMVIVGILSL